MITKYTGYCLFCGRPREAKHHLIFGSRRSLADDDELTAPACNKCHNMGPKDEKIHNNVMAEKLSRITGQLEWEKNYLLNLLSQDEEEREKFYDEAREAFRDRYEKSFL